MKIVNVRRTVACVDILDGATVHVTRWKHCPGLAAGRVPKDDNPVFFALARKFLWPDDATEFVHWRCCGSEAWIGCPSFFDQEEPKDAYLVCPECGTPGIVMHDEEGL